MRVCTLGTSTCVLAGGTLHARPPGQLLLLSLSYPAPVACRRYLNEGFEGGATTYYSPAPPDSADRVLDARGVAPRAGNILVFPHGEVSERQWGHLGGERGVRGYRICGDNLGAVGSPT